MGAGSWVDGDFLLLRADTGAVSKLNGSAATIWEGIGSGATLGQLAAILRDRYGIEEERCLRDAITMAHSLLDRGLIDLDNC